MGILKNFPKIGKAVYRIQKKFFPKTLFVNSGDYWKNRYQKGGNSGPGSYNRLAEWKAEILNDFVNSNEIKSVIELGCGDGNQLAYFNFPQYIGFDISPQAVALCKEKYGDDATKTFLLTEELNNHKAQLSLSLDVLYHLIEKDVFEQYLHQLFNLSTEYVVIYAYNKDDDFDFGPHVKPRKFTDWITHNRPEFRLIKHIPNKYPYEHGNEGATSFADFYIFSKYSKI